MVDRMLFKNFVVDRISNFNAYSWYRCFLKTSKQYLMTRPVLEENSLLKNLKITKASKI